MIVSIVSSIFLILCTFLTKTYSLNLSQEQNHECDPNRIYKGKNFTCACSSDGMWLDKECERYLDPRERKDCEPNTYIFLDCNVCLCGPDGRINKNRCTKHDCDPINTRRSKSIVATCRINTFYSLAPCQLCYCVNKHKLVCNATPKTEKVVLGKFELNQCSGNILKEISDLMPEKPLRAGKMSKKDKSKTVKSKKATTVLDIETNIRSVDDKTDESNEVQTGVKHQNKKKHRNKDAFKKDKFVKKKTSEATGDDGWTDSSEEKPKKQSISNKSKSLHTKTESNPETDDKGANNLLTINLPYVLDRVLNMVLRKSMVSLESGNNCTPGATLKNGCNKCFCLNNGKMLCTNNKCE